MNKQQLISEIEDLREASKNLEGGEHNKPFSEYRKFENKYMEFRREQGTVSAKGHKIWLSQFKKKQLENEYYFLVNCRFEYGF